MTKEQFEKAQKIQIQIANFGDDVLWIKDLHEDIKNDCGISFGCHDTERFIGLSDEEGTFIIEILVERKQKQIEELQKEFEAL